MTQTASILLSLSIALLVGLLLSRLAKIIQLPAVTAYLIAGVLIGPFCLGAIGVDGIGITSHQLEGCEKGKVLVTKLCLSDSLRPHGL